MQQQRVFAAIIEQALAPLPQDLRSGTEGFTNAAEQVADDLYRLCIEFGVDYNEFKPKVLDEVLHRSRQRRPTGAQGRRKSYLDAFESRLPVVVFALELMREDEAF